MTIHLDDMGIDERGELILDLEEQIGNLKSALTKHSTLHWEMVSAIVMEQVHLENKVEEFEQSWELYHNACVRGITLWRDAEQGREMVSPDQANLIAWLLALVERAEAVPPEV